MTEPLTVPDTAASAIASEVRRYGVVSVETGGFLLAPLGTEAVSIVAFAGAKGIKRDRLYLEISEIALDRLFGFAEDKQCWVPAQFHSHAGPAFLSRTDREHGLRVPGFISAVVPDFAEPSARMTAWAWFRFDQGGWHSVSSPPAAQRDLCQVTFDEEGVRDS
jgi:proteasome lid subunit RPN8/RPN11